VLEKSSATQYLAKNMSELALAACDIKGRQEPVNFSKV
jgi:hypothetical protein